MRKKKSKINILITGLGASGCIGLIKGLRENRERNIRIIGVDTNKSIAAKYLVDRFIQVAPRKSKKYLNQILYICRKEKIDLIYPVPTAELELFAKQKKRYEGMGIKVAISDPHGLKIANNKAKLYDHLREAGMKCVPNYRNVRNMKEFKHAMKHLGYPRRSICFRKPVGTGAKGFRIMDPRANYVNILLNHNPDSTYMSPQEAISVLKKAKSFPELIVQEDLPGEEYDVDVLADQGRTLAIIPRINGKMYGGMTLQAKSVYKRDLIQLTKKIVSYLKLSFVVSLTFKYSSKGHPMILEINPRIPASVIATLGSGVNMPYLSIKMALGEKIVVPKIMWGASVIGYWHHALISSKGRLISRA